MKATVLALCGLWLTLVCCAPGVCQDSTFEDDVRRQQEEFDRLFQQQNEDFQALVDSLLAEFDAFVQAEQEAFAAFQAEVEQKWETFAGPTEKDWVEYSDDKETRSVVDFAEGEARVEVLVDADAAAADPDLAVQRLGEAVAELATDPGQTRDYPVQDLPPRPLGEEPVLGGQLVDGAGEPVTTENAQAFAEQVVQTAEVEQTPVSSRDGVERVKVAVTVKLVPHHLRVRAEKFHDTVQEYSRRYDLDPRLVFAVIHTESFFNPKARSPVPAYGLMQLVPTSGGKDAYRFVYRQDETLSPDYLFVPDNNVELGCAYMKLLVDRYFKGTENGLSKIYCAICAYNTGAGNVSRAFTGENKLGPAIKVINSLTPEQVLAKLKKDLPYEETRQYIVKVLDRIQYYEEWK